MKMNIVFIAAAVILLLSAFSGFRKGFFKTAITMTSFLIAIVIVSAIHPMVTAVVRERTGIEETVRHTVYELLAEAGEHAAFDGTVFDGAVGEFGDDGTLPKSWENALRSLPLEQVGEKLGLTGLSADQLLEQVGLERIVEYYVDYYSGILIKSISYVISVLIAYLLIRIGLLIADVMGAIPVLSMLNRVAGLCLGLIRGVVILWLLGLVIALCAGHERMAPVLNMIRESGMLLFLYRNNPLAWLILPRGTGSL